MVELAHIVLRHCQRSLAYSQMGYLWPIEFSRLVAIYDECATADGHHSRKTTRSNRVPPEGSIDEADKQ